MHTAPGLDVGTTLAAQIASMPSGQKNCFRMAKTIPRFDLQPELEDTTSDSEEPTAPPPLLSKKPITVRCNNKTCKDCRVIANVDTNTETLELSHFESMSKIQRELLHLHNRFGHNNFKTLQKLCSKHLLPHHLRNIKALLV